MNSRSSLTCAALVVMLFTYGCGGDDTGNQNNQAQNNQDQQEQASLKFANLSNAKALITKEKLIEPVATQASLPGGSGGAAKAGSSASDAPFKYRIAKAGEVRSTDSSGESQGKTNLLVMDQDGNTHLALDTNSDVKILYTVASPSGESVYVALDMDHGHSHNLIAQKNCALYQVETKDNSHRCVKEGLYVNQIDDQYRQSISGNQKPIQFDNDNNMYFSASSFITEVNEYCEWHENDQCVRWHSSSWISQYDWKPRIYKQDATSGEVTAVTQDNQQVDFFVALASGEVAIQSRDTTTNKSRLYLVQSDSQVIDLSGETWGVDFFTVDSGNTLVFGEHNWSSNGNDGVRFARPRPQGGAEWASLDTSLFANPDGNNGWYNPRPRRVLMGDDGRIYAVFKGQEKINNDNQYIYFLSVYQILPYNPIPKLKLPLEGDQDWWHWMMQTPFQVAKGYIYYKETIDIDNWGTADVIRMRNLETKDTLTFLQPEANGDGRYQLYTWKISGTMLYFSALHKVNNTVVTGEIDTLKVRDATGGQAPTDAITLYNLASAQESVSKVQDLEVLTPTKPDADTGNRPMVTQAHQDTNNLYSMSVDFSKYMDHNSIDEGVTITSSDKDEGPDKDGAIPALKVWVNKTLHLIPSLNGLATRKTSAPMSPDTTYTLNLADTIRDSYSWNLSSDDAKDYPIKMRPESGFYIDTLPEDLEVNNQVAAGKVLRYAGHQGDNNYSNEYRRVDLGELSSTNFRVEFSQKVSSNWQGPQWVISKSEDTNDSFNGRIFKLGMNGNDAYINYNREYSTYTEYNIRKAIDNSQIIGGRWARYRLDFYAGNFKMYYLDDDGSKDNSNFVEVKDSNLTGLTDLSASKNDKLHLYLQVDDAAAAFDNIEITALGSDGEVLDDQPDSNYQQDFENLDGLPATYQETTNDTD